MTNFGVQDIECNMVDCIVIIVVAIFDIGVIANL